MSADGDPAFDIDGAIRRIPDHPHAGSPLLRPHAALPERPGPDGLRRTGSPTGRGSRRPEVVLGIEARGFVLGGAIAQSLGDRLRRRPQARQAAGRPRRPRLRARVRHGRPRGALRRRAPRAEGAGPRRPAGHRRHGARGLPAGGGARRRGGGGRRGRRADLPARAGEPCGGTTWCHWSPTTARTLRDDDGPDRRGHRRQRNQGGGGGLASRGADRATGSAWRRRSRPSPTPWSRRPPGSSPTLGPDEGPVGIGLPVRARRRHRDDGGQHRPDLGRREGRGAVHGGHRPAPAWSSTTPTRPVVAEIRFGAGQGRQGRRPDAHPGQRDRVGAVPRRGAGAEHGARPHRDPGQGRRAARLGRSAGAPRPVDQGVGAAAGRVPQPRGPARLAGPDHPGRRHLPAGRQVPRAAERAPAGGGRHAAQRGGHRGRRGPRA